MRILQTVKYFHPSKGGMESVVKDIVNGIIASANYCMFTVYANSHFALYRKLSVTTKQLHSIKEFTPFLFKSQPLNFRYSSLRDLLEHTDIVHHHYPFPNMELALLRHMDILKTKKIIITWHANVKNSRWGWIKKAYNPVIKKLLDIATYIVVTSPHLIENSDILKEYIDKIKIIPLSFDPTTNIKHQLPKKFPINRKFRLLFVGRLRAYKGVDLLIEAVKELDVELVIVGHGENEKKLKHKVYELNLNDKITFMHGLSDSDLSAVYQKSDLFILPSINEAEAFGVVQLEAMSNGLPVINTNLASGVPFVSLHGITGLTVEPKNVVQLKEAIKYIISNSSMYEDYSKNTIVRAKEFSREKMAAAYLTLYNS